MLGLIFGILAGILNFWVLSRFAKSAVNGRPGLGMACVGIVLPLVPLALLLFCALLLREELVWAGVGLAVSMLVGALWQVLRPQRKAKKEGKKA